MITINLLPYELRPIKRTPLPYILSLAVSAIVLLAIASTYIAKQAEVAEVRAELERNQADLSSLQAIVTEYNDLSLKKGQLAEQVKAIGEIVSDRIIWSRQLYNLSRLCQDNAWYKSITISFKTFSETQMIMNPQTQKMEPRTIQVPKQVLTLIGYILPGAEGQAELNLLLEGFQNDEEFSSLFRLEPIDFKDTILDETPVREFTLAYVIGNWGKDAAQ